MPDKSSFVVELGFALGSLLYMLAAKGEDYEKVFNWIQKPKKFDTGFLFKEMGNVVMSGYNLALTLNGKNQGNYFIDYLHSKTALFNEN